MRTQPDHCIVDLRTQEFVCLNCQSRLKPPVTTSAVAYVKASASFTHLHRNCHRPPVGKP